MPYLDVSRIAFIPFLPILGVILIAVSICYVVYQRCFHPLSKYPGSWIPSLTNIWMSYWTWRFSLHDRVRELHIRYQSPVVRIGPNSLHFWNTAAIAPIYKSGRSMPKTEFFDAFTTFNPNMFGTRDEEIHSTRRRQLAHAFSMKEVKGMESILDQELVTLCNRIHHYAKTGETFDMKDAMSRYILDILGEVAFTRSFKSQTTKQSEGVHDAIRGHLALACTIGPLPLQAVSKFLIKYSPIPRLHQLMAARTRLRNLTAECVKTRLELPIGSVAKDRKDLLKSLIDARDPETGARLSVLDINTEAYAFIVAGAHTTANTLTLLFWNLLQHKQTILPQVVSELDSKLPRLASPLESGGQGSVYQVDALEKQLPYTMACVLENFRANAVFTVPLWRRVTQTGGAEIDGFNIPKGTNVAIINHVLHHNPDDTAFQADHDTFDPDRWLDEKRALGKDNYLLPFSIGHRMCVGKNLAMANILKATATLLSEFEFIPQTDLSENRFTSMGVGELADSLLLKARVRR